MARQGLKTNWESEPFEAIVSAVETPLSPGVRALFVAQLRAVFIVLAKFRDTGRMRLQTYTDYRWIKSDADDWPFSFRQLCVALGLDAEAVREAFRNLGLLSPALSERVYNIEHPPRPKRKRGKKSAAERRRRKRLRMKKLRAARRTVGRRRIGLGRRRRRG